MRNVIYTLALLLIFLANKSLAQVHVDGYYRSNGTYVEPHYRSSPDGNPYNNYSYPGNYNPYTGKIAGGTEEAYLRNYYKTYPSYSSTSVSLNNYSTMLLSTDYWSVRPNTNSVLVDNDGIQIGSARKNLTSENLFNVYDMNDNVIGLVEFKNRKYVVYDSYGLKLYTRGRNGKIQSGSTVMKIYSYYLCGVIGLLLIGAASGK